MQLILGGARSGKSTLALQLAQQMAEKNGHALVYVATASARDQEMEQRILQHQEERDEHWQTVEEPLLLADCLTGMEADATVVIDCLTLWISNCIHEGTWRQERIKLLSLVDACVSAGRRQNWIFVSNEVGSGIVPLGELTREFVDASGWLHQQLAKRCDVVTLVVAGLPMRIKG